MEYEGSHGPNMVEVQEALHKNGQEEAPRHQGISRRQGKLQRICKQC